MLKCDVFRKEREEKVSNLVLDIFLLKIRILEENIENGKLEFFKSGKIEFKPLLHYEDAVQKMYKETFGTSEIGSSLEVEINLEVEKKVEKCLSKYGWKLYLEENDSGCKAYIIPHDTPVDGEDSP